MCEYRIKDTYTKAQMFENKIEMFCIDKTKNFYAMTEIHTK